MPASLQSSVTRPTVSAEPQGWRLAALDVPTVRILLLAKLMDRISARRLHETGELNLAEWRLLARLVESGEATVGHLAEQSWVDRAEVSRAATALEARGITTRKVNAQDARTPLLYVTPKGMELYRVVMAERMAFHAELIADLTADECRQMDDMLLKIAHRLHGKTMVRE